MSRASLRATQGIASASERQQSAPQSWRNISMPVLPAVATMTPRDTSLGPPSSGRLTSLGPRWDLAYDAESPQGNTCASERQQSAPQAWCNVSMPQLPAVATMTPRDTSLGPPSPGRLTSMGPRWDLAYDVVGPGPTVPSSVPEMRHPSRGQSTGVEVLMTSLLSEHERRMVSHLEQHGRTLEQMKKQLDQLQHSNRGSEPTLDHWTDLVKSTISAFAKPPGQAQAILQPLDEEECKPSPMAADIPEDLTTPLLQKASPNQEEPLERPSKMTASSIPKPLQWLGKKTSSTRMQSLFPKVEELRNFIEDTLREHRYDVEDLYYSTGNFQWMARSERFQNFILAVVVSNVLWIGVETDYNKAAVLCDAGLIFQIVDNTYCCLFVVDIMIRLFAFERKCYAFTDPWFAFDAVLVVLMAMETWFLVAFYLLFGYNTGGKWAQHLQVLRMVRLVRLVKVARVARLLQSVPELAVLGQGMVRGVRSLLAVFAMLMLIIYAFGVAFCVILQDTDIALGVFEDVPHAMNSLLLIVLCGPDKDFMKRLLAENWPCWVVYLTFWLISTLILLNMMTAMLCDVVAKSSEGSREASLMSRMHATLSAVASELDDDGDGRIDREEFEIMIKDPRMTKSLTELGVDIVAVASFAQFIYDQTDDISYDDFAELAGRFRTEKVATGKDMMDLRHYLTMEMLQTTSILSANNMGKPTQGDDDDDDNDNDDDDSGNQEVTQ